MAWRSVGILLLLALALRLGWGLSRGAGVDERLPDQREYLELGRNLLHEHTLRFFDSRFGQFIYAGRMGGYPLFVAGCGASPRAVRVAQAILDTSVVLAAYLLGRRWMGHGPSLVAGGLVAVNPFLIYFTGLILSETLFTAMLAWALVLLAWRSNFLWGGLVLAAAIHVRPSAVGLGVVLGYAAVFVHRPAASGEGGREAKPRRGRFGLPVGATMLLLMAASIAPWAMRNQARLGRGVWLTTNSGITRFDGFHDGASGGSDQRFLNWPDLRGMLMLDEVDRDAALDKRAGEWTKECWRKQPWALAELTARKVVRTWSPVPLSGEFGRTLYVVAAGVYAIPLFVGVVAGLAAGGLPRSARALLLLPAVYITVVHAASVGSLRYRVPVEPALAVLAAAGAAAGLAALRRPGFRRENAG